MICYDYFYKYRLDPGGRWPGHWDLFISSWDNSSRVRFVYDNISAERKDWLIHPQYRLGDESLPEGGIVLATSEDDAIVRYLDGLEADGISLARISLCVDITGMIRPHLMFLTKMLRTRGVRRFDVIYAEPISYADRENTRFNDGDVLQTREVIGFQGLNTSSETREVLVVAPGFDDFSLKEVMSDKEGATLVEIFGLPSLQADMYQLNVLKAHSNAPRRGRGLHSRRFASASDPFAVASELSRVREQLELEMANRFYFSPLSTKAQALGFALFYMAECENTPASIIYPYTASYAPGTGSGVSGAWRYVIDFELLDRLVSRASDPQAHPRLST
ncbi:hypothetical protein [Ancylobacter amanitiformis]|uniref:Uncharacterized protein n=1 Tax=Ancylobacter amanitiformis TaxID=217069 RepID=A0ABU0LV75_9HYPH|nr:hypothetical protein [Ancylobacter amanitiformis]MDQ0512570.1 hypothetical protein [Ancylobacter amanitiformis]